MINSIPGFSSVSLQPRELPGLNTDKIAGLPAAEATQSLGKTSSSEPFGSIVDRFVSGVDTSMRQATAEQAKVINGDSTNLHQAMISMQESSVAFSLMVEVRNKLVEGYQELMRMQL